MHMHSTPIKGTVSDACFIDIIEDMISLHFLSSDSWPIFVPYIHVRRLVLKHNTALLLFDEATRVSLATEFFGETHWDDTMVYKSVQADLHLMLQAHIDLLRISTSHSSFHTASFYSYGHFIFAGVAEDLCLVCRKCFMYSPWVPKRNRTQNTNKHNFTKNADFQWNVAFLSHCYS